ncbi:MAG: hypothetical protein RJA63_3671 [Pseudomonadota bacterium]|jgi:serine/threonine-protein kinase HipA
MARLLEVWLFSDHVGTLAQEQGRLSFTYSPAWLAARHAVPLSQSLPLQADAFDDRTTRPFFAGLLPEGDKRRLVAQSLQVSASNDFAILDGIGGECAGAVTFLEQGQALPQADFPHDVRWLDETEIVRLLDEMPSRPMLAGENGLRLSLAGAQDKLPVLVEGERIGLPLNGAPSSHILKLPIAGVTDSVWNEAFCMSLAKAMKLDVASVQVRQVSDKAFLLVERYDRQHDASGKLLRLHQEDFCQALQVAPEYKYQNEGGPDLVAGFALVRAAVKPSAPSVLRLLDFVVFNALIGNHDAHAKNFSLLYASRGVTLAPLYDALSTAIYPELTDKMAMKIGSKYRFTEVLARHWDGFAEAAGLSPAQTRRRVVQLAQKIPSSAKQLQQDWASQGKDSPVVASIVTLIGERSALTLRRLTSSEA